MQLDEQGERAGLEHFKTAVSLLKQIMDTKKVDSIERENWLKQLYDETSTFYIFKEAEGF
jgi:hypothetical protein